MPSSITFCLISLLSFVVNAQEIITSKEIDTNQDYKIDRIERFKNGDLISVSRDTMYVGKFNETSYYFSYESPVKPTEVIEKDTDDDGKVDRIEKIYRNPKTDMKITTYKVTKRRGPAAVERNWSTYSKLSELKTKDTVMCGGELNLESLAVMKLIGSVKDVRFSLDDGYYKTGWGYDIHQSCMDRWGADKFPEVLKTSMQSGLRCLENLAKTSKTPNGAYRNAKDFEYLLSSKTIAMTCDEKKEWEDTIAHASAGPAYKIKDSKMQHPYISINPTMPKIVGKASKKELEEMAKTLFHEQFHNIGLKHGQDIEYAYSCETCCIDSKESKEMKDAACKVCSGNYSSMTDRSYILDLISLGDYSSNANHNAEVAALSFQNEFPEDRFGILAYAAAASGPSTPIGNELGMILKTKFSNLTTTEKLLLDRSLQFKTDKAVEPFSKIIAESQFTIYYEQNTGKALANYEKQLPQLKKLLELNKKAKGSIKFFYEDAVKMLKDQLWTIRLKNYPENKSPENEKAYELLSALGLYN
jgi:hypothetical protein